MRMDFRVEVDGGMLMDVQGVVNLKVVNWFREVSKELFQSDHSISWIFDEVGNNLIIFSVVVSRTILL